MTNQEKVELLENIKYNFNCYTLRIIDRHEFFNAIEEFIEIL